MSVKFNFLVLCETWLNSEILDSEFGLSQLYQIFRADRDSSVINRSRGGGVMIFCDINYKATVICSVSNWFELLIVRITSDVNIIIVCVYMPPNSQLQKYEDLCSLIETSIEPYHGSNCWIIGDFNIPDWSNDETVTMTPQANSVKNLNFFLGCKQINVVQNSFGRLLDLVSTNANDHSLEENIDPLVEVDPYHPPLSIEIPISYTVNNAGSRKLYWNFKKANYLGICTQLNLVNWSSIFQGKDVNDCVKCFYDYMYDAIQRYVPVNLTKRLSYPKWCSSTLIKLIEKKKSAHAAYKRTGSMSCHQKFVSLRSTCKQLSRRDYAVFMKNSEAEISHDSSHFWKHVKDLKSSKGLPGEMQFGDLVSGDSLEISNYFADFFSSNYSDPNLMIPPPVEDSTDFSQLNLCNVTLTLSEVFEALEKIDLKKSPGPDGIPPILINSCRFALAAPLTLLYNMSLTTGCFPQAWKIGQIVPIHKSGKLNIVENYRAITKISHVSKIFELLVYRVMERVCSRSIIEEQHGFIKGRSTTTNLLSMQQFITDGLEKNKQVDIIYTDFVKAFDRINHDILCSRLSNFGINGLFLKWLNNFLKERCQFVQVGDFRSKLSNVPSGCPQGGHISPLLFLIFINCVAHIFRDFEVRFWLFADDLKFAIVVKSIEDCIKLQLVLKKFNEWCLSCGLFLNYQKCFIVSFTRSPDYINFNYMIIDTVLERKTEVKDLGVYFDQKLKFDVHIESICCRAMKMLGFIKRNSADFKASTVKLLYLSLVRPILEYNVSVWRPWKTTYIEKIERVQRKFMRYFCFKSNVVRDEFSYIDLLCLFEINSLESRRELIDVVTAYKIINDVFDCNDLVSYLRFAVHGSTRSRSMFSIPFYRTDVGRNSGVTRLMSICNKYDSIDFCHDTLSSVKRNCLIDSL